MSISLNRNFNQHWTDANGNPAGGVSCGRGFAISWQNGQLGRGVERKEPNGAFVEDVLKAVVTRLRFYQSGRFECRENADALIHLGQAIDALESRSRDRETRGVEGTHYQ